MIIYTFEMDMFKKFYLFTPFLLWSYFSFFSMFRFKVGSLNIQGLRTPGKHRSLSRFFDAQNLSILFLQETHFVSSSDDWSKFSSGKSLWAGSRGILRARAFSSVRGGVSMYVGCSSTQTVDS